ncbi:MAG TPA: bifunctional glutamine-synthetase adenylyltransferase/deadenyltransferase, partial [Acidimicrobiia bacterium]|nr:bifunctional glutamine-synthetase adenylyltransferase/deadenyltransferase [Acidimicrobiia bacterium]
MPDRLPDDLRRRVARGPEPEATAARLASIFDAAPELAASAADDDHLGQGLVAVTGASRALADVVRRLGGRAVPLLAAVPDAPPLRGDDPADLSRSIAERLVWIASADLTGRIEMPQVGALLSELADEATRLALQLADADDHLALVALGKWGGGELNYASDIDLVAIHEGDDSAAVRAVERIVAVLATRVDGGIGLRCDFDLRPEGRSGPLSRTLDSYQAYWRRWAEPWEAQAMLKARFAAGDRALGDDFMEAAAAHAFPETLGADAVRSIRAMKRRAEALVAGPDELKRGVGGIRDVEFAVQLLQLVHGRADPGLRSANTLSGLRLLADGGYVTAEDADGFAESYRWLRHVEHRLQLYDLRQTHALPADPLARERVAKAAGYRDAGAAGALEAFEADLVRHRARVRTIHERLFYRPLMEAFAATPPDPAALDRQMGAFGFTDSAAMQRAVTELTAGLSRRGGLMRQLLPLLLRWLSESPDPDLGLAQLHRLATRPPNDEALVAVLRDDPAAGERLCRLLGTSRLAGPLAARLPLTNLHLGDDGALAAAPGAAALRDEAALRLVARETTADRAESLRRFYGEQLLGISAADLGGAADGDSVAGRLTAVAEAVLEAALTAVVSGLGSVPPVAVIGAGKLGGAELDYASDLDLLIVFERSDDESDAAAARIAEGLVGLMGRPAAGLPLPEIDLGLRPDGRKGALARSMDAYRDYWAGWAQTWERQALLRTRPVAGDRELGERFVAAARRVVVERGLDAEATRQIRAMKA